MASKPKYDQIMELLDEYRDVCTTYGQVCMAGDMPGLKIPDRAGVRHELDAQIGKLLQERRKYENATQNLISRIERTYDGSDYTKDDI